MIRLIGYFFGIGAVMVLGVAAAAAIYLGHVTKDLPDYEVLNSYAPPVTTRVHAGNGALMAEYARERRLYLPIQAIPTASRQPSFRPKTRISTSIPASI